jgi:uncharacterized protein
MHAVQTSTRPHAVPGPATGIGLRAAHQREILERRPGSRWLEAHSENYFGRGAQREALMRIRADHELSLHGVGLSLGSIEPLDRLHLQELGELVHELQPWAVSEHLSWCHAGGRFVNDLLPLPYTREVLAHMIQRVGQVQDFLRRPILLENVSSYLQFAGAELSEWELLGELATASGCGILLDVNNVYVSAMNHGFDPLSYIRHLPQGAVREIHLAGHQVTWVRGRELRIDTHDAPVCDAVWELFRAALLRFGAVPALVEWDARLPSLDVLVAEAAKADAVREAVHAVPA